ncbi:MAG: sigma-70 family RNA polymerase sigma factor [Clostridia bacterium]|nr:sigma-70 family RNA polymerase sigma factor [Clostridia bacterium]NCC42542.1 sigma-70 family RNA polymerase sigma factor [Clostridia bacterium]
MREEHDLVRQIKAAQADAAVADNFIQKYLPFIKSETAKFLKRSPIEGEDDELSIAMFAFYESMTGYKKSRGSFLKLAAVTIRNRLIDHYRREKKHSVVISYDQEQTVGESSVSMIDTLADDNNDIEAHGSRSAAKEEILHFSKQLEKYGLSLSDVADSCPKQERTMMSCMDVLAYARRNPEVLDQMITSGKLPITKLAQETGVDKKTLERHRRYLFAILLAYTNGFEIIRGHLHELRRQEAETV